MDSCIFALLNNLSATEYTISSDFGYSNNLFNVSSMHCCLPNSAQRIKKGSTLRRETFSSLKHSSTYSGYNQPSGKPKALMIASICPKDIGFDGFPCRIALRLPRFRPQIFANEARLWPERDRFFSISERIVVNFPSTRHPQSLT
ncbi:hypothetical protein D3C71_1137050 [compost metagenome]